MWESTERSFQAYVRPLVNFTSLKYLGRVLTAADDYWPVLVGNLLKAWKRWAWMMRILGREVISSRVSGMFSKAVVQAVLLLWSETCMLTPYLHGTGPSKFPA